MGKWDAIALIVVVVVFVAVAAVLIVKMLADAGVFS